MTHNDFRYIPESEFTQTSHGPLPVQPEAKALRKPNQIARDAAAAAYRIRSQEPDPKRWGPLIGACSTISLPQLRHRRIPAL